MRILITNTILDRASGTVSYVQDLSRGLVKRGHEVVVYSNIIGQVGRQLQSQGISVIPSLKKMPFTPDVIHGHHTYETSQAVLFFPKVPALYVCHDRTAPHDRPPHLNTIVRYVAVDENCLERILFEEQIPQEKTCVLYNFVNLDRFKPRSPLPESPKRAVIFSNYAKKETYVPVIQKACQRMGVSLDVIGSGMRCYTETPEAILGSYDLVFAKAKCALEAMAVGCAVICCDFRGVGGMVTQERFEYMRRYNFGMKSLNHSHDVGLLCEEMARYDAKQAACISNRVRKEASMEIFLEHIEALYKTVSRDSVALIVDAQTRQAFVKMQKQRVFKTLIRKLFIHVPLTRTLYCECARLFSSAF